MNLNTKTIHHTLRKTALSIVLTLTTGLISFAPFAAKADPAAAPAEKTSIQLKRVATSANPAVVTLSKNIFKTETYQAHYTVQVPYETTETYTVQVPYQDTETYVEQVPYQDTETYTEQVPYQVSVPYTDYETDYRSEQRCDNVTHYRNECHSEQQCYIVPGSGGGQQCRDVQECGTNAQGEQICKTRQVCDGNDSGPQQRCEDKQVCNQVPYNEQECHTEQVPYQREVTKYRNETQYRNETRQRTVTKYRSETKTRTVTKTRDEQRTRTVTKTRDEDRCCVDKTRQVFDRQLSFQVSVHFPEAAVLGPKDSETLTVSLTSADPAVIDIKSTSTVYNYKIASQVVNGAGVIVELAIAPKYDINNAGPSTIKGLVVDISPTYGKFRITFTDSFSGAKVVSQYMIDVNDALTGNLIETVQVGKPDANGRYMTRITTVLDKKTKIIATVKVKRSSPDIQDGVLLFSVVGKN